MKYPVIIGRKFLRAVLLVIDPNVNRRQGSNTKHSNFIKRSRVIISTKRLKKRAESLGHDVMKL